MMAHSIRPTQESPRWWPLLTGALADQAAEAVRAITTELHKPFTHTGARIAERLSSQALLHGYLARVWPGGEDPEHAARYLDGALDEVGSRWMRPALHGGFVQVAWVMHHLGAHLLPDQLGAEEDPLEDVEAALEEALGVEHWVQHYDLIAGLVGLGVFALERLPGARARRCLERIVHHLLDVSELGPQGRAWRTRPELIPTTTRKTRHDGGYNLGVAHGNPGAVGLLAAAWAHGIDRARVGPALEEAVRWLLAQQQPAGSLSAFAYYGDDEVRRSQVARGAWCYGDPGVAATLLMAARAVGNAEWERVAVETGLRAVRRPEETREVMDGGLCHGEAGLAHLFHRMYRLTGEEAFGREARECFARLLARRVPGEGVGGYAAWFPREIYPDRVEDNASFLTGSVGIALALLAAISDEEPAWDRMLLASFRPPLESGHGR
ncbi:subtilin biosynthesis protein spaC [Corallococcus coralloides DSM 2259]|uniref:Subtilin biosynthesis protein spaC n=1 Tax=Corallococcus coralloides (strain ATCC 25202 / DSM 2259 / NBRC 100086 / M2) TaxID=1144275 RepID=H8MNE5_CORCM|nr:lanthionine synthetase C family protein [Corallococcus coralloides]AFE10376.1 subtilin biosynthesis protein spaC [Corallococcus coralloides DSM 2259]